MARHLARHKAKHAKIIKIKKQKHAGLIDPKVAKPPQFKGQAGWIRP